MTTKNFQVKTMIDVESIPLRDWSGFTSFGDKKEVYCPKNETEISILIRKCYTRQKKLRVVGDRTSWSALWYCQDIIMSTKYLNTIKEINLQNHTVTCETGVTVKDLQEALWAEGLILKTAPGIDWITVGGAISTGSHGSGCASMSSSLISCCLVLGNAEGEVIKIEENDERMDAIRISLGMLGVLSTVTLRVVDAFSVRVKQTRILTKNWKQFLTQGEMSYALWFPHTEYTVLVQANILDSPSSFTSEEEPAENVPDLSRYALAVSELANLMPSTFPARNRYLLDILFENKEMTGPMHKLLTSFESTPIAGSEWSIPYSRFEAVLADMQQEINQGNLFLPAPVFLKKVEAETAWLSAADEPRVQCGIYHHLIEGTPVHTKDMVMQIEQLMLAYGGRPHLGKLTYLNPDALKKLYFRWDKFNTLRRKMDSTGMFWNTAIERLFGNPESQL